MDFKGIGQNEKKKKATFKRPHSVQVQLIGRSQNDKILDMENRLVIARD